MSRTLYLDLVGGCAGDMLLAALLDAGASLDEVVAAVDAIGLPGVKLELHDVEIESLAAKRVDVTVHGSLGDSSHDHGHGHRPYRTVRDLMEAASIADDVRQRALSAFRLLAEAEGASHGVDVEDVTFHEVGADDAIADIVGVAAAIESLGVDEVVVGTIPLGQGVTQGAHGPIPLPAPATLHVLRGVPVRASGLDGEMVTPTGAALLRSQGTRFSPMPQMTINRIGMGAGRRTWPDRPNVVRAVVGVTSADERLVMVEANIDDMTSEHESALRDALLAAGARDAWSTSIAMKKGRTGFTVSALVDADREDVVTSAMFRHSTTLGLRRWPVSRRVLPRKSVEVETEFGVVRVKVGTPPDGPERVMPEHDDCARLAAGAETSVRAVFEAAQRAYWSSDG